MWRITWLKVNSVLLVFCTLAYTALHMWGWALFAAVGVFGNMALIPFVEEAYGPNKRD